jgi:hypothetical protein
VPTAGLDDGAVAFRRAERSRDNVGAPSTVADPLARVRQRSAVRPPSDSTVAVEPPPSTVQADRKPAPVVVPSDTWDSADWTPTPADSPAAQAGRHDAVDRASLSSSAALIAGAVTAAETAGPAADGTHIDRPDSVTAAEEETDTASLMWELSSLGRKQRPRPPGDPRVPRQDPTPSTRDGSAKKRTSRFGR